MINCKSNGSVSGAVSIWRSSVGQSNRTGQLSGKSVGLLHGDRQIIFGIVTGSITRTHQFNAIHIFPACAPLGGYSCGINVSVVFYRCAVSVLKSKVGGFPILKIGGACSSFYARVIARRNITLLPHCQDIAVDACDPAVVHHTVGFHHFIDTDLHLTVICTGTQSQRVEIGIAQINSAVKLSVGRGTLIGN